LYQELLGTSYHKYGTGEDHVNSNTVRHGTLQVEQHERGKRNATAETSRTDGH
jgi:hypothetical protein